MRWLERAAEVAAMALLAFVLAANTAQAKHNENALVGDRVDLLRILNGDGREPHGVVTGSCIVKRDDRDPEPPYWIYVFLPRSNTRGYVVDEVLDPKQGLLVTNMGYIHFDGGKLTVTDNMGGLGLTAIYQGAAEWIVHGHLRVVSSFDRAVASTPTDHCPSAGTLMDRPNERASARRGRR